MIKIRQMRTDDIPEVLTINQQYQNRPLSREELMKFNDLQEGICIVAEEDTKVVGFLLLLLSQTAASILDVETDTEHMGSPITGYLLEAARKIAIENGITAFYKTRAFHTPVF